MYRSRNVLKQLRAKYQQGVTLIELVISMVIISIAVVGVLLVMTFTSSHSADPMVEHQAVAIAESYLEEIMLLPFDEDAASGGITAEGALGPDAGESRGTFDDVNDFAGLADIGATDLNGAPISGLANYSVAVTVSTDGDLGPVGSKVAAADAQLVTVTVTHTSGVAITLSGYRTRY